MSDPILFFDGVCNLCNASVDFVIAHESSPRLRFSSLQGETAAKHIGEAKAATLSSLILWKDDCVYERSDAALEVARYLRAPWRWLRLFKIVPRPLRDCVYDWIARNRYRWFGKKDTCRVPTPAERTRFLP